MKQIFFAFFGIILLAAPCWSALIFVVSGYINYPSSLWNQYGKLMAIGVGVAP